MPAGFPSAAFKLTRMSNSYFQFKQFLVNQENVSMCVNTDGVLLGAWATLPATTISAQQNLTSKNNAIRVLDVGTGTGVIALMIAQRLADNCKSCTLSTNGEGFQQSKCQIVAIDVDNASCKQAQENFQQSKWSNSLVAKHISLQDFTKDFLQASEASKIKTLQTSTQDTQPLQTTATQCNAEQFFDLIISNPPYFNNALKNPSEAKRTARHTDTLSYQDLTDAASKLLKPNGRLSVIIPFDEYPTMQSAIITTNKNILCAEGLQDSANPAASSKEESSFALRLSRLCKVFTLKQDPAPKRLLLEFTKEQNPSSVQEEALCIQYTPTTFTSAYKSLTKDFYLKF